MAKTFSYEHTAQYYETDQMAVVHHSNYIRWFEETRIAFFESIGLGYREMEERGIISPVVGVSARYKTMTKFYDTVVVTLEIQKYTGIKLAFTYTITDKATGEVRCTGESEHCFISPEGRILSLKKADPEVHEKMMQYLEGA